MAWTTDYEANETENAEHGVTICRARVGELVCVLERGHAGECSPLRYDRATKPVTGLMECYGIDATTAAAFHRNPYRDAIIAKLGTPNPDAQDGTRAVLLYLLRRKHSWQGDHNKTCAHCSLQKIAVQRGSKTRTHYFDEAGKEWTFLPYSCRPTGYWSRSGEPAVNQMQAYGAAASDLPPIGTTLSIRLDDGNETFLVTGHNVEANTFDCDVFVGGKTEVDRCVLVTPGWIKNMGERVTVEPPRLINDISLVDFSVVTDPLPGYEFKGPFKSVVEPMPKGDEWQVHRQDNITAREPEGTGWEPFAAWCTPDPNSYEEVIMWRRHVSGAGPSRAEKALRVQLDTIKTELEGLAVKVRTIVAGRDEAVSVIASMLSDEDRKSLRLFFVGNPRDDFQCGLEQARLLGKGRALTSLGKLVAISLFTRKAGQ